jgi:hypothetical protein
MGKCARRQVRRLKRQPDLGICMKQIDLLLTPEDLASLKDLNSADAAVEICRIHFRRENSSVTFPKSPNKADLCVVFPGAPAFDIEVKGTEETGIAWNQFKVSGHPSYKLLKKGMLLYRVSSIGSREVSIFILTYGEDFEMTAEPRWRIHPVRKARAEQSGTS